jgi:hypothetical protein
MRFAQDYENPMGGSIPLEFYKLSIFYSCLYNSVMGVGIAQSYSHWLRAGRPGGGGSLIPGRVNFSLLHIVQTGSGVHPTSYKMGTEGSFPGVKRQGREADHSPPTTAEVKKMWIYISTPPYVFMA